MSFARPNTMIDWFRDQERRLQAWREELAALGTANAEQLSWLERHQAWLRREVERLSAQKPVLAPVRAARARPASWLGL